MRRSSCSVPASGQRPYSPCCTRCPPPRRVVRSGGSTERVTGQSTRLRKSRVDLLQTLVNGRSHIVYSRPDPEDERGVDYDSVGHVDTPLLDRLGVTRDADFYLCGPPSFLHDLTAGLKTWGADSTRIHAEVFGPEAPITPGIAQASHPSGSPSRRKTRRRPTDFIYTKRAHGFVGFTVLQFAGTRGSLRRSRTVVVPYRGLPYLRMRIDRRKCPLSA